MKRSSAAAHGAALSDVPQSGGQHGAPLFSLPESDLERASGARRARFLLPRAPYLLFSLFLFTSACRRSELPHPAAAKAKETGKEAAAGPADEAPASGSLPLAEIRGIRFVAVPAPREEGAWFPAEALADESAQAMLTAPVEGIVEAILVAPGARVTAGAGLLVLRSPELARLEADWRIAAAHLERARREREREEHLFERGIGARRELEAAEAEAAAAEAEEGAARLALEARGVRPESAGARLTVCAPRSGIVSSYRVLLGQGVAAGAELGGFQSAYGALARLELPLPVPEEWRAGTTTEARRADGQRWTARLEGVPMALATETRRLSYRLRLSGAPLPLPGTPLEVRVPLARATILPQSALQQVEGTWGVFVRQGSVASFRPVRRGAELGGDVMVLSGVATGEAVAADGAYLLKSMLLKQRSGGDEHEH
jgi:cobalt-zinc-cadmium efflux system membrane fusion protein